MICGRCKDDLEPSKAFDLLGSKVCRSCYFEAAEQPKELKKEDLERLKREVEAETSGLLPQQMLFDLIEQGYDRLVQGGTSFDEEVERLAVEIQRLTGLVVARKTLEILDALGKMTSEQEEEVRRVIRKLSKL